MSGHALAAELEGIARTTHHSLATIEHVAETARIVAVSEEHIIDFVDFAVRLASDAESADLWAIAVQKLMDPP